MPSKRSASVSNIGQATGVTASGHIERRVEQGGDELVGLERDEVGGATRPTPIELHRDPELGLDREHDAALGGAVELGEHDAGDVDRLGELRAPG